MSEVPPAGKAPLPVSVARRVDQVCDQFERLWLTSQRPRIEEGTAGAEEPVRSALLRELLHLELHYRRRAGERPAPDDYYARFPTHHDLIDRVFHEAAPPSTPSFHRSAEDARPALSTPAEADAYFTNDRFPTLDVVSEGLPGDLPVIPGYQILGLLDKGGMGVVYKARHLLLKRLVAVKMMRHGDEAEPHELARFRGEAEAAARLQHPNIVPIYEIGTCAGRPFLALEYVSSGNLSQRLDGAPQPPAEAARLVETLAGAVQAAHQQGIIHRDLKPANVLLTADGTPKITDFGLAKRLDNKSAQTLTGVVLGTPSYMAPEQAHGRLQEVGPATDVYALGAILYEMLTGRPPFRGASSMETLEQVKTQEPVSPSRLQPRLPHDLETICLKALHKEPHRRYASAGALADDLRRFRAGEPIRARRVRTWERALKWARRRPLTAASAGFLVVAAVGLAVGGVAWVQIQQRHLQALRDEMERRIGEGQVALAGQKWSEARMILRDAQTQADAEPSLQSFREQAAGLLAVAEERLRDQQQRAEADAAFQSFLQLRDEALFRGSGLLVQAGLSVDPPAAQAAARRALDRVGAIRDGANGPADDLAFTKDQRDEVVAGCYELWLLLAETEAQQDPQAGSARALRALERAARLGVVTRAFHLARARYLRLQKREAEARAAEADAAALQPNSALDFFLLGVQEHRRGSLRQAAEHFRNALRGRPDSFWAEYFLALCYLRQGKPESAEASLTACLGRRPDFAWCYLLRGFAHGQLHRFGEAEADFQEAATLNRQAQPGPNAEMAYSLAYNRGVLRVGEAQALEQLATLALPEGLFPAGPPGLSIASLARAYRTQRLAEAVIDLEKAAQLRPDQYQAYESLAPVLQAQGKNAEAVAQLGKALAAAEALTQAHRAERSVLARLYGQRARIYAADRDLAPALKDLDQSIGLYRERPSRSAAALANDYVEKGRLLLGSHQPAEALTAFEAALQARPDSAEASRGRAFALLELQCYCEAVSAFDQYLAGGRRDADAYRGRGLAQAELGRYEAAMDDYRQALRIRPDWRTYTNLGWIYLVQGAPQLAHRQFEEALRFPEADGYAYSGRGLTNAKLGRFPEALADARRALGRGPQEARLLCGVARVYAILVGQLDAGRAPASRATPALKYQYQEEALDLLRRALALSRPEQRRDFWLTYIDRDPELRPLRGSSGYVRLEPRAPGVSNK